MVTTRFVRKPAESAKKIAIPLVYAHYWVNFRSLIPKISIKFGMVFRILLFLRKIQGHDRAFFDSRNSC